MDLDADDGGGWDLTGDRFAWEDPADLEDARSRVHGRETTDYPVHSAMMKANVMIILALAIVALSLSFELGRDALFERTPKAMHAMLTQMFSELTLLGFIGILLFFVEQSTSIEVRPPPLCRSDTGGTYTDWRLDVCHITATAHS
jgi:hypothetical protein